MSVFNMVKLYVYIHTHIYIYVCVSVAQSCPTLCNPTDYSPPGFSVHGILQARILKGIAIPFSRGTSQPRDRTLVSYIAGRFFTIWDIYIYIHIYIYIYIYRQETWIWSLGQEYPLEEGTAVHTSILAWKIPWTEEPGELKSMRLQRVRHDWAAHTYGSLHTLY